MAKMEEVAIKAGREGAALPVTDVQLQREFEWKFQEWRKHDHYVHLACGIPCECEDEYCLG